MLRRVIAKRVELVDLIKMHKTDSYISTYWLQYLNLTD